MERNRRCGEYIGRVGLRRNSGRPAAANWIAAAEGPGVALTGGGGFSMSGARFGCAAPDGSR
jgi:hypothetical protein